MARPKRSNIDTLCDLFADLSIDAQDGILLTLTAIHRQAKRQAQRRPAIHPGAVYDDHPRPEEDETELALAGEDDVERARRLRMSETKWTPGPWEYSPVSGIVGSLIQSHLGINVGAAFPQGTPQRFSAPLTEANACLMAAAPKLYEVLNALAHESQGFLASRAAHGNTNITVMRSRIVDAFNVLAKARGEA